MADRLITAPGSEPLTLDEAKDQVRQELDADDDQLTDAIADARNWVEEFTGRALLPQTWELVLEGFPSGRSIRIPKPPLQDVTSVQYTKSDGTVVPLDAAEYSVDTVAEPGRVVLAYGKSWPTAELAPVDAVVIRFDAGYADAASIPPGIKRLLRLVVGHFYEHREGAEEIPKGILQLAWQHKVLELA